MAEQEPNAQLTAFSSSNAQAVAWSTGKAALAEAPLYWLTTVRPAGLPHVTPLIGAWWDGALYFVTGSGERKAKNLAGNPNCVLTTGRNGIDDGFDLALEGEAELVSDQAELGAVADTFEAKYGAELLESGGTWFGLGEQIRTGGAQLYRVTPSKVFGWEKGKTFSETKWQFPR